jgi:hypothetical protein
MEEEMNIDQLSFGQRVKKEYLIFKDAMKLRVRQRYFLFWLLWGLAPTFSGISYTLMKDVYKISDLEYGIIATVSTFAMLFGVYLFQNHFSAYPFRTLARIACWILLGSCIIDLAMFLRLNIAVGIPDIVLLMLGSGPISSLKFSLTVIPSLVFAHKMTPHHIEATMIALATSLMNMSRAFMGELIGAWINKVFVGVDNSNVSTQYIYLIYFTMAGAIYHLLIVRVIPTEEEILEALQ